MLRYALEKNAQYLCLNNSGRNGFKPINRSHGRHTDIYEVRGWPYNKAFSTTPIIVKSKSWSLTSRQANKAVVITQNRKKKVLRPGSSDSQTSALWFLRVGETKFGTVVRHYHTKKNSRVDSFLQLTAIFLNLYQILFVFFPLF